MASRSSDGRRYYFGLIRGTKHRFYDPESPIIAPESEPISETGSLETRSSSGESANHRSLSGSRRRYPQSTSEIPDPVVDASSSVCLDGIVGICSAAIWIGSRIASPEMILEAEMLPHLICSRPMFIGGTNDEADQHGGA